jgi:hypothetical protein
MGMNSVTKVDDRGLVVIDIGEDEWVELNDRYDKEQIKQMISDAIDTFDIALPYRNHTRADMVKSFDDLIAFDTSTIINEGAFYTRYPYEAKKLDMYVGLSNKGGAASDYFHQKTRWAADSMNSPSPYRSWTIEKFRMTLLNALWSLKYTHVNMTNLRSCIHLRKYVAAQFRPTAAKAIYEHFDAKHVLDFSSGWGDRLAAFFAADCTETYTGIDPNIGLVDGYARQIEYYSSVVDGKQAKMIPSCAEDMQYEPNSFDLVFTSPPYFNVEKYTHEAEQSWKKFRKLDAWLEGFLFAAVKKAWDALKVGGHLVVNISDCYTGHRINQLCNPLCEYMATLDDAEYQGSIGLRMAKRPRTKIANREGIFAEPIFVWKKG